MAETKTDRELINKFGGNALDGLGQNGSEQAEPPIFGPWSSTRLKTVRLSDVEARPIHWLWKEKIARGKLTMISGDPGLGKSQITLALAAAVSKGARWPVGGGYAPQGSTILLANEDGIADTIRPRLDAAGADCSRIHALEMVQETSEDGELVNRSFRLAKDVDQLAALIDRLGDVAMVAIDPISEYLGGTDSHKNSDVRALLSPLTNMAEQHDVAVVAVTHLNKGSGSAIYRSIGSIAFTAAARTVWAVMKDKNDPARRLMLPVKNNLGNDQDGMAYRAETAANGSPVVMWEPDPVVIDINEALSAETDDTRSERDEAVEWLQIELADGPVLVRELQKLAKQAGHSWSTVKRARSELEVTSKKVAMQGGWRWHLPDPKPEGAHEGTEGAQQNNVGTFGDGEHLRDELDGVML